MKENITVCTNTTRYVISFVHTVPLVIESIYIKMVDDKMTPYKGGFIMKIYLFCNLGLSTSILVDDMIAAGVKQGMEVEVKAFPISDLKTYAKDIDVAILGPQVGYRLKEASKICSEVNIPVGVIPMKAYGMCDGSATLSFALELLEDKEI